jgi:hypothetical protein
LIVAAWQVLVKIVEENNAAHGEAVACTDRDVVDFFEQHNSARACAFKLGSLEKQEVIPEKVVVVGKKKFNVRRPGPQLAWCQHEAVANEGVLSWCEPTKLPTA